MKRLTLMLASLAAASVAMATTYVRVEKDGSKTYSDRPLPGGQPVDLQPAQTYQAPKTDVNAAPNRNPEDADDFTYTSCAITPANDTSFTNPGSVTISVTPVPSLRAGDTVNMVVDGKPADPTLSQLLVEEIQRGTHTASVSLRDESGRVLCSASVSFHVIRPSLNSPARR